MAPVKPKASFSILGLALFFSILFPRQANAQSFQDSLFTSGWNTSVYSQTPPSPPATAVAGVAPFGGGTNWRTLTHTFSGGMAMFAVHPGPHTYSFSSNSVSSIRFRYIVSASGGNASYSPLILQGGQYYAPTRDTIVPGAPVQIDRILTANDFQLILPNGGLDPTQHPNFSCGAREVRFGYYTANSNPGAPGPTPIVLNSRLRDWRVDLVTRSCAPPVNPCCPPLTTSFVKDQLRLLQPMTVGTNFNFQYAAAAPYQTQMQAYINYLNAMNPAITTISVAWTVTHQGTGLAAPSVPPGAVLETAITHWVCTNPGCPAAAPNVQFPGLPLVPNTWYRVTAAASLNNGLTFWPVDCPPAVFEYDMREIP